MFKKLILIILFLVLGQAYIQAQDARIYFYRKSKFKGSLIAYDVYVDSALVGKITTGQVLVYKVKPGTHHVWAPSHGSCPHEPQSGHKKVIVGSTRYL